MPQSATEIQAASPTNTLSQDFRALFPAAVSLPLFCAVGHILISCLDYGYLILAVTYVPANIVLALIRTMVHRYADQQGAPMLYANIWAAIHLLGAVNGVLSSIFMAQVEAVPVGGPVIVGCFAALWGVVCTVEGPVLKLPIGHRLMGHASVLAAHVSAPPMSELGQPSEALLIAATLVMGDLYGCIVEANLNEVRHQAFLAGKEHEQRRRSPASSGGIRRVAFVKETPSKGLWRGEPLAAPSAAEASPGREPGRPSQLARVAALNAMIARTCHDLAAATTSQSASAASADGAGSSAHAGDARLTHGDNGVRPSGGALPAGSHAGWLAADLRSLAYTLSLSPSSLGPSLSSSFGFASESPLGSPPLASEALAVDVHSKAARQGEAGHVQDEAAYRSFHFRRMLPLHVTGGVIALCLLSLVPETALKLSAPARLSLLCGIAALLCVRLASHLCLAPSTAQARPADD